MTSRGILLATASVCPTTSKPHRANILSSNFDDIGIGCGIDARGVQWWALLLGRGGQRQAAQQQHRGQRNQTHGRVSLRKHEL